MRFTFYFLLFTAVLSAQSQFNAHFYPKTLRIDYQHVGDSVNNDIFIEELIEEPFWSGNPASLIDPFPYGKYFITVMDSASEEVIYTKNYSTLFSEWQTTAEAKKIKKSFHETVVIPFPKEKCVVSFFSRDKRNVPALKLRFIVDPASYFIKKERRYKFPAFKVQYSGSSERKADLVILPDGYTAEEMGKFKLDCEKFTKYLFKASPYKEHASDFNVWGVEAPSLQSGTDIPAQGIWKETILNCSFYTFDLERYCMTTDNRSVRDVAANAPYDVIYILVNSSKYGGGAIFNHYAVCVNDHNYEEYIFTHEFGHSFASLADEYFDSQTAYEDFYSQDVEPTDPNLTTLVDFNSKWKHLVKEGTPVPTPDSAKYRDKVGAFEGGGYVRKGIYRPKYDCSMKSISVDNFCPVCKDAISAMIRYYSREK